MNLKSLILMLASSVPALHANEEDLTSPPVVTAKAWVISDATTGKLLWRHEADQQRKAASTAKVMCAYTVFQLATKDPSLMSEWVKISQLAGTTVGSTAELKPGEQIQVKDALLAMLLPSGNDAGNALAEHFHPRLAPPDEVLLNAGLDNPLLNTRSHFISEMNRFARQIGMTQTIYRSSFGDGGTEHDRTTAAADPLRPCSYPHSGQPPPPGNTKLASKRWMAACAQQVGKTPTHCLNSTSATMASKPDSLTKPDTV